MLKMAPSWGIAFYCCLCFESMIKYARTLCPMAHREYACVCLCVNVSVHTIVGGIQAGVSPRRSVDGDMSASVMSLLADEGYCGTHSNSFHSLSQFPRKAPTWLEGGLSERPSCPFLFLNLFLLAFHSFVYQNTGDETWYIAILPFTLNYFITSANRQAKWYCFAPSKLLNCGKPVHAEVFIYMRLCIDQSGIYDAHLHSQCMC